jgi:hypothetical protein
MLTTPIPPFKKRKTKPPRASDAPPPPAGPAVVIAALVPGGIGMVVTLQFDRPLSLIGSPPYTTEGAITVDGNNPLLVDVWAPDTLAMEMPTEVSSGGVWNINATPAWCETELAVSGGTLG